MPKLSTHNSKNRSSRKQRGRIKRRGATRKNQNRKRNHHTRRNKKRSIRRKRKQVGGNRVEHYKKLKSLANHILHNTKGYSESYIVGSMAIALHEEKNSKKIEGEYPNDIDIVIPVKKGNMVIVPDIPGMTSDNPEATKGATFVDNKDPTLSVDVIQGPILQSYDNDVVIIDGLRVLNVGLLKKRYQEVVNDLKQDTKQEKEKEKLARLNALPTTDEDVSDDETDLFEKYGEVSGSLF